MNTALAIEQGGGTHVANRYGEAALLAARNGPHDSANPKIRWEAAMEKLYPTSSAARKKGAPRGAFLGLCEEGLVKGIPVGQYSASKINKDYAVRAARLLVEGTPASSRSALWRAVTQGSEEKENGQIDVVLALWNNNLIVRTP